MKNSILEKELSLLKQKVMLKPSGGTSASISPLHARANNLSNGSHPSGNLKSRNSTSSNSSSNSSLNVNSSLNGFAFSKAHLYKQTSTRTNSLRRNQKGIDENTDSSFNYYNNTGMKKETIRKPTQMNN